MSPVAISRVAPPATAVRTVVAVPATSVPGSISPAAIRAWTPSARYSCQRAYRSVTTSRMAGSARPSWDVRADSGQPGPWARYFSITRSRQASQAARLVSWPSMGCWSSRTCWASYRATASSRSDRPSGK